MATPLKIQIITPKEVAFDGTAEAVTIPAEAGEMQVFQGHIPVLTRLAKGVVRLETPGTAPISFEVDEGYCRVTQNEVSLLIDTCVSL